MAERECCYEGCERAATTLDRDGDLACAEHAAESWQGVSWRSLTLYDGGGNGPREIDIESREGLALLREYRATGAMDAVWPVSESEMDAAERAGLDLADLGPSVEQIDWTGFPEV